MSNLAICHASAAMNANLNHVKGLRKTENCRKCIFQGVWTELRSKVRFLRQSFTKYFETNLGNRETQSFNVEFNGWFCSIF